MAVTVLIDTSTVPSKPSQRTALHCPSLHCTAQPSHMLTYSTPSTAAVGGHQGSSGRSKPLNMNTHHPLVYTRYTFIYNWTNM